MAFFVLVHGAFHGGWCWRDVVPLLEAEGHRADAIDLPGHGDDRTPLATVTLATNARRVEERVEAAGERVVLVGHSLGGMAVTQVAAAAPHRIAALVCVTAFVPGHGQLMADLPRRDPGDPVDGHRIVDAASGTFSFAAEAVRETLYGECSDEVASWAIERLEPESLAAAAGRVDLSAARGAQPVHAYVECLRDRSISLERQRAMQRSGACERVLPIDTDHSPVPLTPPRARRPVAGARAFLTAPAP